MKLTLVTMATTACFCARSFPVPPVCQYRSFNAFCSEGHFPQSDARCIEDCVSDSGGNHGDRSFAGPHSQALRAIDQDNINRGHLEVHVKAGISLPVNRGNLFVVPGDLLHQRATHALKNASFSLISQAIRIRDWSGVYGRNKSLWFNASAPQVYIHFSDERRVAVVALVGHACHSASADNTVIWNARFGRGTALPFGSLRCCFQAIDNPLLTKMFDSERNRVRLHPCTQLIHEALMSKGVLNAQRGAQRTSKEWRFHCVRKNALAANCPGARALPANTACNVGGRQIAAVAKFSGRFCCSTRRNCFRRVSEQRSCNHISGLIVTGPAAFGSCPGFAIPGNDGAVLVDPGTLLDDAGRTKVFPRHLILARKLDSYRPANRLRQYRSIKGDGICAVDSIASGAASVDHAHVLEWQRQQPGHDASRRIHRLCC